MSCGKVLSHLRLIDWKRTPRTIIHHRSPSWSHPQSPLSPPRSFCPFSTTPQQGRSQDAPQNSTTKAYHPRRIILVRHGESLGNVDEATYVSTPDWKVPLTPRGRAQAQAAGRSLRTLVLDGEDPGALHTMFCYYSPYLRTVETLREMEVGLRTGDGEGEAAIRVIATREEPRISEQQFGNFQNVGAIRAAKAERHTFGRFYYRFRSGESGLDVYSRVSSFIATLMRDCTQYQKAGYDLDRTDVVVVMHGLSLRLFLMRWFQFGVEVFENSVNPENAELVVLEKQCNTGEYRWYQLDPVQCEKLNLPLESCEPKNIDLRHISDGDNDGF
eukprot:CAMPEP_0113301866 /NCGR_PEP_ID=MMETSP0010_2-20120614/2912_1 /TAXON_ID=216773 ORGANISM="Corethron hystrix, Strain 308" /NCGR_SAMPLE_ID=MMETSP0010_2 /ASSEMBLY_ACC=CAM_ASM_000155 /LENGTH=328 /DNA_ID=CAMNT_0000155551 /DNA_START=128 /DNA_END=1114 /DNA_ORIENTATION=+ /assembly_acc=CAM_ASM_000155